MINYINMYGLSLFFYLEREKKRTKITAIKKKKKKKKEMNDYVEECMKKGSTRKRERERQEER